MNHQGQKTKTKQTKNPTELAPSTPTRERGKHLEFFLPRTRRSGEASREGTPVGMMQNFLEEAHHKPRTHSTHTQVPGFETVKTPKTRQRGQSSHVLH